MALYLVLSFLAGAGSLAALAIMFGGSGKAAEQRKYEARFHNHCVMEMLAAIIIRNNGQGRMADHAFEASNYVDEMKPYLTK